MSDGDVDHKVIYGSLVCLGITYSKLQLRRLKESDKRQAVQDPRQQMSDRRKTSGHTVTDIRTLNLEWM